MYDSFYNLAEKPFKINTDPRFLWRGEKHAEALANLRYGLLDGNGFVVLTGDIGTGKTTLSNALLESLDDSVLIAKINHPNLETIEFLTLVAKTFDPSVSISGKSDLLLFFNSYLQQANSQGKVALLIVDEAHRLSIDLLEEIRLLSNIEQAGKRLLNIILVGQNELKPMLASPHCRALRQRITLYYEIQGLSREETSRYVQHRLAVSGLHYRLFTHAAVQKIHAYSRGNPRLINILCDRALLTGFVKERRTIDDDIILECAREINLRDQTGMTLRANAMGSLIGLKNNLSAWLTQLTAVMNKNEQWDPTQLRHKLYIAAAKAMAGIRRAAQFAQGSIGGLSKIRRSKIISTVFAVGSAVVLLAITAGAYRTVDVKVNESTADSQIMEDGRPAISPVGQRPGIHEARGAAVLAPADEKPSPTHERSATKQDHQPEGVSPEEVSTAAESKPLPLESASAALKQQNFEKAIELIEAGAIDDADRRPLADVVYSKALLGRAKELLPTSPLQAENLLLKAVETKPDMAEAYLILGKYYTGIKDFSRAVEVYQKAIHLDPDAADAIFNLGFIYASTGDFASAEKSFARVVALKPPYLDKSLFNLAVVQQKLGKRQESIANLEMAVAMAPQNKKTRAYLNQVRVSAVDRQKKKGT